MQFSPAELDRLSFALAWRITAIDLYIKQSGIGRDSEDALEQADLKQLLARVSRARHPMVTP